MQTTIEEKASVEEIDSYELWKREMGLDRNMTQEEILEIAKEFAYYGW